MTLIRLRTLALQPGVIGRTLLHLTLVGGVLIGLLAMHTISSASSEHMTTASVMSADTSHPESHGDVAPTPAETATDCGGMCDPGHIMATMACVLALLFSALVLAISASRRWSTFFAALRNRWVAIVAVAVAAMPPPDLNTLSISRT